MNICLFSEQEINEPLSLKDERSEHLIKILHKKEGDTFKAGIINGKEGIATITEIGEKIKFSFQSEKDGLELNPLIMIIGFPRPIQLKRLLRDISALGVSEVHLTGTELGEKSYLKSNLISNGGAEKMLLDGTVQAGTTFIPKLFFHENLLECLNSINLCENLCVALDNINPKDSLKNILMENKKSPSKKNKFISAIGSERGWTDKERKLLEEKGFIRAGMGKRIMRTETAATVSISIILAENDLLC